MKYLPYHNKPRSFSAQLNRMRTRWPDFKVTHCWNAEVIWQGPLKGFQRFYEVGIYWNLKDMDAPFVFLIHPVLAPRDDCGYEDIPHLIYNSDKPESSGFCLFDPDGSEWTNHMLIADTTVPWAAKWLYFYELWHYEGKWRGGGVGPETIAEARAEALREEKLEQENDKEREAPVAVRKALQDTIS